MLVTSSLTQTLAVREIWGMSFEFELDPSECTAATRDDLRSLYDELVVILKEASALATRDAAERG